MDIDPGLAKPRQVTGVRRLIYIVLGLFFVGLGVLGAFLPLLPTTPFLLLASYFFVRSSARLHAWLLRSRVFGGFLLDWQRHRGVRPRVKVTALLVMGTAVLTSILVARLSWPLIGVLVGFASIGAVVVLRLPIIREEPTPAPVLVSEEQVSA